MNSVFGRYFSGTGWLEPMVSYAQNFEDVTLRRAFLDIPIGFYVDIGGYHPTSHSVTKYFYDAGWSGVNVEPNPRLLKLFEQDRPRDTNLGVAIGGSRSTIDLHVVGETGLTSILESVASSHADSGYAVTEVLKTEMITLDDVFAEYCGDRTVDFLKVDVEGAEATILGACNFDACRPRVILVENANDYHEHLISRGYIFCWYDALNRWYIRQEDEWRSDLLARPVSVWDSISNIQRF